MSFSKPTCETPKLDNNTEKLETKAFKKVTEESKKQSMFTAESAKNLAKSVLKLIGMGGLIGGIVAAFKGFSNRVDELGTAFGVIGTKELRDDLIEAERQVTGIGMNLQDVITITSTLTDNFGLSTDEAANLSAKIADSGKAMGLNVSESADLFGSLISIGQLSADQAENFAESTYQLAQANKVNPSAVMKDMAKIVDKQNKNDENYIKMSDDYDRSIAFQTACELIFKGKEQPSGYTEPLLHLNRLKKKSA